MAIQLLALQLLLLLLPGACQEGVLQQAPHPRPKIMERFTANITREGLGPMTSPIAAGSLVYDAVARVYHISGSVEYVRLDHVVENASWYATEDCGYEAYELACQGNCLPGSGFAGLFETFIHTANYSGRDQVHGVACDLWTIVVPPSALFPGNATLCVAGDRPLQVQTPVHRITLLDFSSEVDSSKLELPDACTTTPPACGDGSISSMPVYISHPRTNYNISGQDAADSKGEAAYLCMDKFMWRRGGYELVSAFEVKYVQKFTQYTNYPPPGGSGFGGDQYHIGRSCPELIGKHFGQCDDDAHWHARVGQWLSLPPAGKCIGSKRLGVDCTWQISRRVVTIELSCLMTQRSLSEQCDSAVAPFEEVESTLLKALRSEDASQGGCPRVREPECSSHPACAHLVGDCCPSMDGTMLDCCHNSTLMGIVV